MKRISSRQNPLVRAFRELGANPDSSGVRLLLDGAHLVREAAASLELEVVAVSAAKLHTQSEEGVLALTLERQGIDVLSVNPKVFGVMSRVKTPSGIVAIARRKPVPAAAICQHAEAFILVAVDVQDPGNLGSLLRVAEAAGGTGALVCGASATPFSSKALRGSMGSAFRLPVAGGLSIDAAVHCLKTFGVRTIGAIARGGEALERVSWSGRIALVLGGEGSGLADNTVAQCDTRVTIPMVPPVESLNVAVAGAILMYSARRYQS
jgi:TrmH family RNA methyltransferase